ncbi:MAG: methylenetetrahydrofolate reductase [Bacteroidia bacterium]|nr:methylenetetrahydrofolate reductase [Bacteroidia bacterium]MDW8134091.1 methylenetetrahydrofolate reductase [Bacteroidia bacterium]
MHVAEILSREKNPFISVEIIPPRRGSNVQQVHSAVESLLPYHPRYINITSHAAEVIWQEQPDGTFRRRVKRRSPGTFGLCAVIKYKYGIEPVPHLLCHGFTREETEDALIELHYLGVENVMALQGEEKYARPPRPDRTVNAFAVELVEQISAMNRGCYLDELTDAQPTNFCIGVAAYPEKHFQAPNLAFDIANLKRKQEAGASYAITQMFFDNKYYFDFVERASAAGVRIPIIPGLKILTRREHLHSLPRNFYITIPEALASAVLAAKDDTEVLEIGLEWAYQQAIDLLSHGVLNLHFYTMLYTRPLIRLMERLKIG